MANLEARMPVVTNKFDNEPSRANCDAIVNLTQEMYDCMSDGPKKDRMKDNLENMISACNSKLIFSIKTIEKSIRIIFKVKEIDFSIKNCW